MKLLGIALGFLTVIPIKNTDYEQGDIGRAAVYFPFVGLIIGVLVGFFHVLLREVLSPSISAILALTVWAGLSGFLHLDGLSDCADALFYAGSTEKRLMILKDSRVGSFSVVLLILYFLLKSRSFETLPGNIEWSIFLTAYAGVMARWVMVFIAQISDPARSEGLGREFKTGLQESHWWISLLLPVAMTILGSYLLGLHVLIAGGMVVLLGWAISRFVKRQLGGFTGDVLGMAVELSELLCLLVFAVR
ncbi:MAG: adenosylcobinamide-GDP ribazoletransferase [Anaerolineae bacterium]|jgi:adenosylcobinamide-GDP ribazoletransferase|nr:adenosylcobinamide-GDP ribazoletransferase [Anaerolineae bacterium]